LISQSAGIIFFGIAQVQSSEGRWDGVHEGFVLVDGPFDGISDGTRDGMLEGTAEGKIDGSLDGRFEGIMDGVLEGIVEGIMDGTLDGIKEGKPDGILLGLLLPCMRTLGATHIPKLVKGSTSQIGLLQSSLVWHWHVSGGTFDDGLGILTGSKDDDGTPSDKVCSGTDSASDVAKEVDDEASSSQAHSVYRISVTISH